MPEEQKTPSDSLHNATESAAASPDTKQDSGWRRIFSPANLKEKLLNPYLWGLVFLLLISGGVVWFVHDQSEETLTIDGGDFMGSTLDEEEFASLAAEQAEIDSNNQTLYVRANSVFDGTMLVRSSLEVQGPLRVGEELTLNDLAVAGQATVNNLDVSQDLNIQGETQFNSATTIQSSLTVNDNLTVGSNANIGGVLTADTIEAGNLNFSGDLTMSGRVITGGGQTGASNGGSVGGGGTVSVNGNNTAGTVNINTGNSPSSGILAQVSFSSAYSGTPRVNVTPVGAATGGLNWYVERTANGFNIGSSSAPSGGANYTFDYFVVQ